MAVDLNMNVVIVDDKTMLRIIRNRLRLLGSESVDEATDGSLTLQELRNKSCGAIISDWKMESMKADGATDTDLLSGPALPGEASKQDEIDPLLASFD